MAFGPLNCDELWMEGATVAVMGVPESLAYAEIAGLPHVPWWHIVAAIVGCRKMRRVSDEDSVLELKTLYRLNT